MKYGVESSVNKCGEYPICQLCKKEDLRKLAEKFPDIAGGWKVKLEPDIHIIRNEDLEFEEIDRLMREIPHN